MNCIHGRQIYTEGKWYCYYCGMTVVTKPKSLEGYKVDGKVRKTLTEYEKMKLSWYRDEKKWVDNIKSRKIIEQNGKKITVLTDSRGKITGELPTK